MFLISFIFAHALVSCPEEHEASDCETQSETGDEKGADSIETVFRNAYFVISLCSYVTSVVSVIVC